jgi:hypothetical protein
MSLRGRLYAESHRPSVAIPRARSGDVLGRNRYFSRDGLSSALDIARIFLAYVRHHTDVRL